MSHNISYQYIQTHQALVQGIATLAYAQVVGVDTEADSLHSYQEKVSLIQISGNGSNLIIDPLAIQDLSPLGELLSRPDVVKVLHGTDYDVVVLKRDLNLRIEPVFDTCLAARACGMQRFSLADLLNRYFGLAVDKRYQKVNWSKRPLPREWLEYAARDTYYLPQLYHLLKNELEVQGRLEMVEEECRILAHREWTGKPFEPNDYLRIKGAATLPERTQRVVRALAVARDQLARKLNQPAFKVLSNHDLIFIATRQPYNEQELARLFPRQSHSIRRRASFWLSAIRQGLQDRTPLPSVQRGQSRPWTRAQKALFQKLREWRDAQAKSEGVEPAMVLSNRELGQLVYSWPKTPEELARLPFLRQWQVKRYGEELIKAFR